MDSSLAEQQRILASDWGGGKSPFGTSWSKFMMWIFIVSDALTFAAFLIAYGFMRNISPEWPKQTEVFNMVLITFMTFILISPARSWPWQSPRRGLRIQSWPFASFCLRSWAE